MSDENFNTIYENAIGRYGTAGFVVGDYVKIKTGAMTNATVKAASQQFQDQLKHLVDSQDDIRIKLTDIYSHKPHKDAEWFTAAIGEEISVGVVHPKIVVPVEILEVDLEAWDNIPAAWQVDSKEDTTQPDALEKELEAKGKKTDDK